MSHDAERWARAQKAGKASAKAVLIELAWRRNPDDGKCFPSVETLAESLEMDRKTVMGATAHLEKIGLIAKRVVWEGRKKFIFYEFPSFNPAEWAMPSESTKKGCAKNGTTKKGSTKNGTYEGTKSGTYGGTENGTETRKVNSKEEQENSSLSPLAPASDDLALTPEIEKPISKGKRSTTKSYDYPRPDGVDDQVWADFVTHRRTKKAAITATAIKRIQTQADLAGISLQEALEITIERNWQSFKFEWWKNAMQTLRAPQRSNINRPLSREQMAWTDDF